MENHLESKAISTGFEVHSTSHVVSTILRYSRLPAPLTTNVLKAIRTHLNLKSPESAMQIEQLYTESFLGKYPIVLLVAGILLSKGSDRTKASALYEAYETEAKGTIKASTVQEMLQEMFELAIIDLKVLYTDVGKDEFTYFEKIKQNIPTGSQKACHALLENSISLPKVTFIEHLTTLKHGSLLHVYGLRQYVHDLSPPNKPKP
jgi:hypothetical protein